jgi:phosphoglycolate phosphatase-like HAD superfamily hydrolase
MRYGKPLLALDFDGVISNSIHDSVRTSVNAYMETRPGHGLPLRSPLDSAESVFEFERVHPGIFSRFRRLIPMGNRAEEYLVIWTLIDSGRADRIADQADFDRVRLEIPAADRDAYAGRFYGLRIEWQNRDPAAWARLLPAFDGIPAALDVLKDRFELAVATSKDMRSVNLLLREYGVEDRFAPELILDKEFSYSKRDHLRRLRELSGLPFDRMVFVDDKLIHLQAVKDLGVRACLALWGFNSEEEHRLAAGEGFTLLGLEEFAGLTP